MTDYPAVLMRGGTSKALFFHEADLPADPQERDRALLGMYGSPDPYRRQLDGVGGATSSTSKVAVIGDGSAHGVDVTYDFGQVGIDTALVDRRGNCGNISSAVGPFAVDEGLVEVTEPLTRVRFLNTNTGKTIVAHVPVTNGRFDPEGDYALPGLSVTGAAIRMDYLDPGGAVTGRLLPTGRLTDDLDIPGWGTVTVSIVDAANPLVFVRFADIGLTGEEPPEQIDADTDALRRIEAVRARAGVIAGIGASPEQVTTDTPSVPKLAFIGPPRPYTTLDGHAIDADDTSLRVSMMSMGRVHASIALTGAICTTVAAAIPDTIVHQTRGPHPADACRIAHPSGVLELSAAPYQTDGQWRVDAVAVYRTARRLMDGTVHAPTH